MTTAAAASTTQVGPRTVSGRPEKLRLGDVLVQQRLISQEQLQKTLELQQQTGKKVGRLLIESGIITEDLLADGLARQLRIPFVNLKTFPFRSDFVRLLPESSARRFRALVLEDKGDSLLVAMADPLDLFAYDEITRLLKRNVNIASVAESQLALACDRLYRRTDEISGLARALEKDLGDAVDFGELTASAGAEGAPVVRLLQSLFEDATQVGASDIPIEPKESGLQIRVRVDGVLQTQTQAEKRIGPALAQRIKLMAGLDISEKRLPQDGRFSVRLKDQTIDVRLSTMPSTHGESVVMRLLSLDGGVRRLDTIGMLPHVLKRFKELLNRESGLILVTGPTGSGKTTTLYAALAEINAAELKVITVEDPVEYRLPGITQVQINDKIELTFAKVLRATLRQDPDVILVGEMRDAETAEIGLRAAITGHLVLSPLPTTDAPSPPFRLPARAVPPGSGVNPFFAVTFPSAAISRAAAFAAPRCSSIIDAVQKVAIGLATPLPVMSKAEPWIGSNMEGKVRSGLRLAVGAMPNDPDRAAARSDRMSACRLLATMVSSVEGLSVIEVVTASTSCRSVRTSG